MPLQDAPQFSVQGRTTTDSEWWTEFADTALNSQIETALANNYSLRTTWERIREAYAATGIERSALSPSLNGLAEGELREGTLASDRTRVSLGIGASYEVDLWGRIRSIVESEELRALASESDYRAASITLASEVALTWFRLAEAHRQAGVINSQIRTNEKVLLVLRERFAVGQSDSADVLRQIQLVESTREQEIIVASDKDILEHRLAVLLGEPPQEFAVRTPPKLPALSPIPHTGLPADLLSRRPDVQAALFRLEAADADVAAAVKDQYPRLDLAAAVSTSAENPSRLFSDWLGSLLGQLAAPLIDGDRRKAEVERTLAVRQRLLADYGQTVLTSFREVEDALAQEAYQDRLVESIADQLSLARTTYDQLRNQYLNGASDFIDVLSALREQQTLERDLITARLDRTVFRISLYRALAGGFETPLERAAPSNTELARAAR